LHSNFRCRHLPVVNQGLDATTDFIYHLAHHLGFDNADGFSGRSHFEKFKCPLVQGFKYMLL